MASPRVTDLLSPECDTECITCHLKHSPKNDCDTMEPKHKNNEKDGVHLKNRLSPLRAWEKWMGFKTDLVWRNIIIISMFHIITVSWVVCKLAVGDYPKWQTILHIYVMIQVSIFGVTAGVHRCWSHRSFKATLPLQWFLVICYSAAGQNTIYEWVRDHRLHHKCSDTPGDPHEASRGFFFSHVGWLMMKKRSEVLRNGSKLDMSDIANNPVVQFHTKHFKLFKLLFCFVLPTLVPPLAWGESWSHAVLSQMFLRYVLCLNITWSVNSFAHIWGNKPYDPNIMPVENWAVSFVTMGEGWHNYHHAFPWDYKAAELAYFINLTTLLLDGFAAIGWAYELKQASPLLVQAVSRNRNELK